MPEPQRLGSTALLGRLQRILDARGITPGPEPLTDEPNPDEPGHPEYHRRTRREFALTRWTAATPRRYQRANATEPRVAAWANAVADRMATPEPGNDQPEEPLPSLLLTGPTGTGKTHQAYGALRHIAESAPRRRYSVIAVPAADMYGELRPTGQAGASEHRLRQLATVPLLLLDDLGSAKASEWTEEVTYRLINERYNTCLPTLFTSNLPPRAEGRPDLVDALGDRIVSRLAEMTTVIDMRGADRRRAAA